MKFGRKATSSASKVAPVERSESLKVGDRVVVSGPGFGPRAGVVKVISTGSAAHAVPNRQCGRDWVERSFATAIITLEGDQVGSFFWASDGVLPWNGMPHGIDRVVNVSISVISK